MYSQKAFELKKREFNYLLPALKNKLIEHKDRCYFVSNNIEDLSDMLSRLKGFYDNYDNIENMILYYCSKSRSLNPFRKSIGQSTL